MAKLMLAGCLRKSVILPNDMWRRTVHRSSLDDAVSLQDQPHVTGAVHAFVPMIRRRGQTPQLGSGDSFDTAVPVAHRAGERQTRGQAVERDSLRVASKGWSGLAFQAGFALKGIVTVRRVRALASVEQSSHPLHCWVSPAKWLAAVSGARLKWTAAACSVMICKVWRAAEHSTSLRSHTWTSSRWDPFCRYCRLCRRTCCCFCPARQSPSRRDQHLPPLSRLQTFARPRLFRWHSICARLEPTDRRERLPSCPTANKRSNLAAWRRKFQSTGCKPARQLRLQHEFAR
jgi:hypothetical protein